MWLGRFLKENSSFWLWNAPLLWRSPTEPISRPKGKDRKKKKKKTWEKERSLISFTWCRSTCRFRRHFSMDKEADLALKPHAVTHTVFMVSQLSSLPTARFPLHLSTLKWTTGTKEITVPRLSCLTTSNSCCKQAKQAGTLSMERSLRATRLAAKQVENMS